MASAICGDHSLWDTASAWTNNSWPELTECFRFTVLDPLACGWLWISVLVYFPYLWTLPQQPLFASWRFKAKIACTLLLIGVHLLSVVEASVVSRMWAHQLADAIWLASLILSSAMLLAELSRGMSRSMVHFAFWVFASICLLVQLYTECMIGGYETDTFHFVLVIVRYILATTLFVLNSLSDYNQPKGKRHNPEQSASALSFVSFAWLEKMMFRGFRSPLKDEDVFELNPEDRCSSVIERFKTKWKEHTKGRQSSSSSGSKVRSKSKHGSVLGEEMHLIGGQSLDVTAKGKRRDYIRQERKIITGKNEENEQPSFFMTLVRTFGFKVLLSQSGMIVFVAMNLMTPFLLGWLIEFAQDLSEPRWHGFVYALGLLSSRMMMTIFNSTCQYLSARLAIQVRSASIAAIFRKALVLSSESRRESTLGEIVTLMSVDTNYLEMFLAQSFVIWLCTFTFFVAVYLLYTVIGVAMLAGLGFISLMLLVNLSIANRMKEYQDKIMVIKDERLRMMGEILGGIKVIKLYGWENIFIRAVNAIRARELKLLFRYCVVDGIDTFAYTASTFWMTFFMFMTFVLITSDHYLSAKTAFVTINYISLIRMSINKLPLIIRSLVKAATSVFRINKFLQSKDLNSANLKRDKTDELAIRVRDGHFTWTPDEPPVLSNINLSIKPGQLVAVVGAVGAGKSSLISALLGEMNQVKGYANLNSSVAYVPQQAWIQNNTVRENILFGKPLNMRHYRKVIEACALQPDFEALAAGDQTEIGEKGINLSGGQKQRVSVARAVYSQSDIILFDDPLSALDSHVGKHIFKQVIGKKGLLKDKTRLLVTHGLQWLPMVDYIVVLNQGQVTEAGTYHELIGHDGPFANFLSQYLAAVDTAGSTTEEAGDPDSEEEECLQGRPPVPALAKIPDPDTVSRTSSTRRRALTYDSGLPRGLRRSPESRGSSFSVHIQALEDEALSDAGDERGHKLIKAEEHAEGKVGWKVYALLLRAYGFKFVAISILFILGFHTAYNTSYIWLTQWNDDKDLANFTELPANSTERFDRNKHFMQIYAFLGIAQTLCCIIYSSILQFRHVTTSRVIHTQLLEGVMHAPMSFFDTVPMGRILNRFSQDLDVLDTDLFLEIEVVVEHGMFSLGIIVIISYTFPPFLGVLVPLIILFYIQQQFYIHTSCQLLRIASANRSPVFSHFSETLSGVSVIRAHEAQERFISDSDCRVDKFQRAMAASYAANKWILSRLDIISYACILSATIFTIYYRGEVQPGLVGLSITFSLLITDELSSVTQMSGLFQTHVVSVERIHEYSTLDSEAPWALESDSTTLQENWPTMGRIQFVDYSTRYRPGLDLVLNSVSFTIEAGEKIGIVGRTGAGKSSMVLSLFRLIEAVSGKIVIDGVNIADVGLHALRQGLTILPQDPILFAGTLRMNLDPFKTKTDEELWQALEHAHLKSFIQSLPQGLDHDVGEGGENLSMGQRQLVCLARTLVRKTKILVLDEATAAVDVETDELIQRTIKQECHDCTVLTIAHRINTVVDYDRIMVLQSGHVIEFAPPSELLKDVNSVFYSLAREAGVITADRNGVS